MRASRILTTWLLLFIMSLISGMAYAEPLMQTFVLRPNYRAMILPGAPSPEIRVEVALDLGEVGLTLDELEVIAELKRNGNTIAQKSYKPPPSSTFNVDLDISADTPPGDYVLVLGLYTDGDSDPLAQDTHELKKLSDEELAGLTSYVDGYNRFILNGEPFFPLGLYVVQCTNGSYAAELDEIASSPFDTLVNYAVNGCGGDATDAHTLGYLDQLESRNLKLIFSLKDYVGHGQEDLDTITQKVNTFKDHLAIISWYMNDELGLEYLPQLEERYQKVIELDDNHPVWSVHWNPLWLQAEAHTTDIVGLDSFPIDNGPITWVAEGADAALAPGKPLWFAPQIFDWKDLEAYLPDDHRVKTGRPPTKAEMRAMTYLAVNHGAKGLIYYSYFNIVDDPDYASRWPQIKEIVREIDQLRPVFLSRYQISTCQVTCNNDDIDFKLMWENNKYYLFAVSTEVPSKIVVDNPNATHVGDWPIVQGNPPDYPYGGDFQENTTLSNGDTATWTPDITEAGDYRVYARWTGGMDRATNAPYTINYDGGSEQVTIDQQANGNRWILLGTYRFATGTSGSVVLTDNANGVVIADAIMWLLKEGDVTTSASFEVNLTDKPAELGTRFEGGRTIPVSDGKFTDNFDPYEVHVYSWESGADRDGDGFDSIEESGPDGTDPNYDGNGDGVPDSEQGNVASGHTYDGQHYVTLAVPGPTTLSHCQVLDNPHSADAPASRNFPYGFFAFRLNGLALGGCTEVTLFLPKDSDIKSYYRYGPTPGHATDHWYEFLYDGETGAEIFQEATQTRIMLHLCDGTRGDDNPVADGKIVDAGAPASIIPGGGGGGGGGCFIATAAHRQP